MNVWKHVEEKYGLKLDRAAAGLPPNGHLIIIKSQQDATHVSPGYNHQEHLHQCAQTLFKTMTMTPSSDKVEPLNKLFTSTSTVEVLTVSPTEARIYHSPQGFEARKLPSLTEREISMNAVKQSVDLTDIDCASKISPPMFANLGDLRTLSHFDNLDDALTKTCHQQALSDTSDAALRDPSSVQIPASPNLSLDVDGIGSSVLGPPHSPQQPLPRNVHQLQVDNLDGKSKQSDPLSRHGIPGGGSLPPRLPRMLRKSTAPARLQSTAKDQQVPLFSGLPDSPEMPVISKDDAFPLDWRRDQAQFLERNLGMKEMLYALDAECSLPRNTNNNFNSRSTIGDVEIPKLTERTPPPPDHLDGQDGPVQRWNDRGPPGYLRMHDKSRMHPNQYSSDFRLPGSMFEDGDGRQWNNAYLHHQHGYSGYPHAGGGSSPSWGSPHGHAYSTGRKRIEQTPWQRDSRQLGAHWVKASKQKPPGPSGTGSKKRKKKKKKAAAAAADKAEDGKTDGGGGAEGADGKENGGENQQQEKKEKKKNDFPYPKPDAHWDAVVEKTTWMKTERGPGFWPSDDRPVKGEYLPEGKSIRIIQRRIVKEKHKGKKLDGDSDSPKHTYHIQYTVADWDDEKRILRTLGKIRSKDQHNTRTVNIDEKDISSIRIRKIEHPFESIK